MVRVDSAFLHQETVKPALSVLQEPQSYPRSKFTALGSVLESGVPTVRNRSGGHGAGATPRQVPTHLAGYVLHLTAAAVVFLAECEKQLP